MRERESKQATDRETETERVSEKDRDGEDKVHTFTDRDTKTNRLIDRITDSKDKLCKLNLFSCQLLALLVPEMALCSLLKERDLCPPITIKTPSKHSLLWSSTKR